MHRNFALPPIKTKIGARLKSLRHERGFSLRDLARRAGCSSSFLSQLELDRSSPTLANLEKICHALKMSVVDVLRDDPRLPEPVAFRVGAEQQPLAMRWSSATMRHLFPPHAPMPFTAVQLSIEVGGMIPARTSRRSMSQVCIVVKGRTEANISGKIYPLAQWDAVYFDLSMPHEWRNVGTELAEIWMVHPYEFTLFEQDEEDFHWAHRNLSETARMAS